MKQVAVATLLAEFDLTDSALAQPEREPPLHLFDLRSATVPADALPGSRPLSLEALQAGELPNVPKDDPIYLVCERGALSELAGLYLEAAGFSEVYSVTGGMKAYRALQVTEAAKSGTAKTETDKTATAE